VIPLPDKLIALERDLSEEKGGFSLFALLLRVTTAGVQDLVVSAPWLNAESRTDLDFIIERVRSVLTDAEIVQLSAVVILPPSHPLVQAINVMLSVEHSDVMFTNNTFVSPDFSMTIKGGLIVTSKRREPLGK
jgi:hypothetical protein